MYDHKNIDKKWQKRWEDEGVFHAQDKSEKEKYYCLIEFPYPSGDGLHLGHPRSYTAIDVIARKKRMQGKNVLYPIGWDAFGLPTENYAIKHHKKPQEVTKENTDTFRRQLKSLGISFDWSREINTTDPEYYKWTQWMFLEFFKAGLAYKAKMPINWCLSCKIGLANEEVVNEKCERCGGDVEKRDKEQWMIAITEYADRLLEDLDYVDYLPKIKKQQQDWIGKSEGVKIDFPLSTLNLQLTIFTTRPDTLFGVTYMVLAPEHELVAKITTDDQKVEMEKYVREARKKSDIERGNVSKEKTGVFTGAFAVNPVNNEKIPVWVADYVLMSYGTGAIMAVPAHDERDFEFAKKFGLPIKDEPFVDSDEIVKKVGGKKTTNFKLRDWVFSRQRYWGEPIPLVDCGECGWVPVANSDLPVILPEVEKYEPTDNGESPLSVITDWVNTTCPRCGREAKRETDTMPNWAGSSWYFLAYAMFGELKNQPSDQLPTSNIQLLKTWMPVDLYNGGMEHTTLHLLYSRFWNKFLFDRGHVPTSEPYMRRHSHGLILAEDGRKMSKSLENVINPDEIIEKFGADTLRVYEMFIGPFEEPVPWSSNGLVGVKRFLDKVMKLEEKVNYIDSDGLEKSLHKTIKKVTEDIEALRFNTAVSQMMIFVNEMTSASQISDKTLDTFTRLLCPFAPHVANELAEKLGEFEFLERGIWPAFDPKFIVDSVVTIAVQVNGKLRGTILVASDISQVDVVVLATQQENVARYLVGEPKKVVYVKGRLLNFVI